MATDVLSLAAAPEQLSGREHQRQVLLHFLGHHFFGASSEHSAHFAHAPASIYVYGAPGTGKTQLVKEVVSRDLPRLMRQHGSTPRRCRVAFVNCLALASPADIFPALCRAFLPPRQCADDAFAALMSAFSSSPVFQLSNKRRRTTSTAHPSSSSSSSRALSPPPPSSSSLSSSSSSSSSSSASPPSKLPRKMSRSDTSATRLRIVTVGADDSVSTDDWHEERNDDDDDVVVLDSDSCDVDDDDDNTDDNDEDDDVDDDDDDGDDDESGGKQQRRRMHYLVIADEVDSLSTADQKTLYQLFELPLISSSSTSGSRSRKLTLICISNVLDLTAKLQRLEREAYRPVTLRFPPYTKDQLLDIARERLSRLPADRAADFDPKALELLAGRVANESGDARRILDLCGQAISLSLSSSSSSSSSVSVSLRTAMDVWNTSHRCSTGSLVQAIACTPLHAQLALLAAVLCSQEHDAAAGRSRAEPSAGLVTAASVEARYRQLCRASMIAPTRFQDLVDQLATSELLTQRRRTVSKRPVVLLVPSVQLIDMRSSLRLSPHPALSALLESINT